MKRTLGLMVGSVGVVVLTTSPVNAQDSRGCWDGRTSYGDSCAEYSTTRRDNKTYFNIRNICDKRIYVRWCAGDKCGVGGIAAWGDRVAYEFATNVTTRVRAVGSTKSSQDWNCRSEYNAW